LPKSLTYRPEKDVQRSICEYLKLRRIPYTVTDAGRHVKQGVKARSKVTEFWPDVTAILPGGRALLIECKSETGKASEGQAAMIEQLRKQGAIAIIARSASDVHEAITGIMK
jgi:hypothetical protein